MIVHSDLQNEDASDPAQIILLTLAIFYVEEVSDTLMLLFDSRLSKNFAF